MSSCQVVKLSSILDVIFVKGKTRSKNLPLFFFPLFFDVLCWDRC